MSRRRSLLTTPARLQCRSPPLTLQRGRSGDFAKTADTCSSICGACRRQLHISVRFTPKAAGARNAAFLVTTNAPRSPHLIPLSGTGTEGLAVTVLQPNGGEKLFTGTSFRIEWSASGGSFSSFDVKFSSNGGSSFANVPGCTVWRHGAKLHLGRARPRDHGGTHPGDRPDQWRRLDFRHLRCQLQHRFGNRAMTLTAPNTAVNWGIGSTQQIKWTSNLGPAALVTIDLSRNGGTSWTQISGPIPNTNSFNWVVSGPATTTARIRVNWANGPIEDVSNVNFQIAAPFVTVTKPNGGEVWVRGTNQTFLWTSNLGAKEFVKIELSTDGGVTWTSMAEAVEAAPDPLSVLIGVDAERWQTGDPLAAGDQHQVPGADHVAGQPGGERHLEREFHNKGAVETTAMRMTIPPRCLRSGALWRA